MEKKEEEAKSKGEVLPEEAPFDSNCITPGEYDYLTESLLLD